MDHSAELPDFRRIFRSEWGPSIHDFDVPRILRLGKERLPDLCPISESLKIVPLNTIVVGGGAIGLSCAWELACRGAQVTLLERGSVGKEASWAGAGMLPSVSDCPTDPLEQLRSLSHRLHPVWAEKLRSLTGIDTGFRRCGGIYLATRAGEAAALAGQLFDWQAEGIDARRLQVPQIGQLEPELLPLAESGKLLTAVELPDDCQIRNPDHLQALRVACVQSQVTIWEESEVLEIESHSDASVVLQTGSGRLTADRVVVCGGAWSGKWLEKFGVSNSVFPVRGQMVLLRTKTKLFDHLILEGNRYLVPRDDGRVLVGANEEEVGFTRGVTTEVIESLIQWAYATVPALRQAHVEKTWSGFRPASIDGMPLIGQMPGHPAIFLATGHFRSGLHLSCGTAVCVADAIMGRAPAVNLDAFRVLRGYTAVPGPAR